MKATCRAIVTALMLFTCILSAWAQGLEKSEFEGVVRDRSGAVIPNATVTLNGDSLIGPPRSIATDAEGRYRFVALAPGTYQLTIEAAGFAQTVRSGLILPLATTLTVDVTLDIATVVETVRVDNRSPVVDVRTSAFVTNLDEQTLRSLPVRRDLAEALILAPGIANPTAVAGLPVAFGGTVGSNGFFLDGVDMTEPRRQQFWLPINYNWVEQLQVVALGGGAQYGEFTGAVANARLRSGSDRFSGLGEYWTTRWQWIDRNGSSLAGREILSWWDSTAQLGGPVRPRRLWFFSGVEFHRRDERPMGYTGVHASNRSPRGLLKLTSAPSTAGRLEGHLQRNRQTITAANAGPRTSPDALSRVHRSDSSGNLRLTQPFGPKTLVEARSGGFASRVVEGPTPPASVDGPPPMQDAATGILSSNVGRYNRRAPRQVNSAIAVSRHVERFLRGAHDLQAGFEFKWNDSVVESRFPGGRFITTRNGQPSQVTVWPGEETRATGRRTALYLDDRWFVASRVTLNLGLRADFNRGSVPQGGTIFSTNPVSPRVGVAWALDRANRTALKANFGRYFDTMFTERIAFMDGSCRLPIRGPGQSPPQAMATSPMPA